MQNTKIDQDASGKNFTLSLPITKKLDSSYLVELKGYDLSIDGCTLSSTPTYTPAVLTLNGGANSVKILDIKGTFESHPLKIIRNGNTIMGLDKDMSISISNTKAEIIFVGNDWRVI